MFVVVVVVVRELTSLQRPRVAPPLERKGAHLPRPLFRHTSLFLGRA